MANWRECKLGDLGEVIGGGTPPRTKAEYWDGDIPWITPGELTGSCKKYVSQTQDCISGLGLEASSAKLLPEGSLLVTSRASIGSSALTARPMATNQGFKNLIPKADVDPSFLFYLSQTLGREMTRRASGTTFLEISGREFERIVIRLPTLAEQQRIAEILDTIAETIQDTERIISKHAGIRARIATDLLAEGSDVAMPQSCKSDQNRNDVPPLGQRQVGMNNRVATRLLDVAESMVDGPFGSSLKTEHYVRDAGVRVVRLANLSEGRYVNEDEAFIEEAHARRLGRHNVRSGDVLVASLGDDNHRPGRACQYPTDFAPGIVKADCFRIRPLDSVDPRFLVEMLNSRSVTSQVRRLAQGVTRDRINLGQLRYVVLQVPPLEEQKRIAQVLDAIDETIEANEEQLGKLRELRSGLAADLLSGQVRTVAA